MTVLFVKLVLAFYHCIVMTGEERQFCYTIDSVGLGIPMLGSALFLEGVDVRKFSSYNNCEFVYLRVIVSSMFAFTRDYQCVI